MDKPHESNKDNSKEEFQPAVDIDSLKALQTNIDKNTSSEAEENNPEVEEIRKEFGNLLKSVVELLDLEGADIHTQEGLQKVAEAAELRVEVLDETGIYVYFSPDGKITNVDFDELIKKIGWHNPKNFAHSKGEINSDLVEEDRTFSHHDNPERVKNYPELDKWIIDLVKQAQANCDKLIGEDASQAIPKVADELAALHDTLTGREPTRDNITYSFEFSPRKQDKYEELVDAGADAGEGSGEYGWIAPNISD